MDTTAMSTRYDYYTHANESDFLSPTIVTTYIYQYVPGTAWGTLGVSYTASYNMSR